MQKEQQQGGPPPSNQALQLKPLEASKRPDSVKLADLSAGILPKYAEEVMPGHVVVHKQSIPEEEDFLVQTDSSLNLK